MPVTTTWSVNSANPVRFAAWSGEDSVVAYQPISGDTHLVSTIGAAVLELLQSAPLSAEAVFKGLFPDEEPMENSIATIKNNFLIHFEQLGLIEKTLS